MVIFIMKYKINLNFLFEQLYSNFTIQHLAIYIFRIQVLADLNKFYIMIDKTKFCIFIKQKNLVEMMYIKTN